MLGLLELGAGWQDFTLQQLVYDRLQVAHFKIARIVCGPCCTAGACALQWCAQ
jgi:hypothetical protein